MSNVPMYGFGGGGGTGGTLTVTAPAGATVTVSKDGKTLTRVAGEDRIVVFRGLQSGTWTLTITDGTQTSSKTVGIVADYATTITFFAATIHITYPAGSVCTVTDGTTTLTAPDTSGAWDCVVPNTGTWTVSLDGTSWEQADISENGQAVDINKWYLYKFGDERADLTGGWVNSNVGSKARIVRGETSISIKMTSYDGAWADNQAAIKSANTIDISKFSKIGVSARNYVGKTSTSAWVGLEVKNVSGSNVASGSISGIKTVSDCEISADVSSITGAYYVRIISNFASIDIDGIWLA